jgi:transcriptional regulator with XRE-family HTH domain
MAINHLIGEKISTIRDYKKIELKDLALKSGLSEAQIIQIETGQSIPSLGVLIRITRALGTRIGTLLDDTLKEGPVVVRANELQSAVSFSTKERREHLTFKSLAPNKAGRHMEPFIVDITPDHSDKPVKSTHEGEEFIYVLDGSVTVHYGSDVFDLKEGDSIYIDSVVKHLVTTREDHARILALVYVPV